MAEEFLRGIAIDWSEKDFKTRFGFIVAEDGRKFFVRDMDVEFDDVGRRFLISGEPLLFREGPSGSGRLPQALNVQRPFKERIDIKSYRESCVVLAPIRGVTPLFLLRMIGGWLAIQDPDERRRLKPEQIVECSVSPPEVVTRASNWYARDIVVLTRNEQEWISSQEASLG